MSVLGSVEEKQTLMKSLNLINASVYEPLLIEGCEEREVFVCGERF